MEIEPRLWERTSYPKIFRNTYWGQFRDIIPSRQFRNNVENRNNLVEKYKIIKGIRNIPKNKRKHFNIPDVLTFRNYDGMAFFHGDHRIDHPECYRTKDKKYIFLFSDDYFDSYKPENNKILLDNGFIELPPIYGQMKTFMKIV